MTNTTITTEDDPFTIYGIEVNGTNLMFFYIFLNILILIALLIYACRSGAKTTAQAKREKIRKRQEAQKERMKKLKSASSEQQDEQKMDDDDHDENDNDDRNNNKDDDNKEHHHVNKTYVIELADRRKQKTGMQRVDSSQSEQSEDEEKEKEKDRKQMMMNIHGHVSSLGVMNSTKIYCGAFVQDIMNRSVIYSAFLVHVWDQGSDLGVIYTWFTEDEGRWEYLGWISIGILCNYRLFSAYSLRKAQRGWRDTLLQVLDLQLFVDVFRSVQEVKPTDSLYWIRAMEAVLESCIQILLQFVYLYQSTSLVVWLSLFGSLTSVIFSLLHYTDVVFLVKEANENDNGCVKLWKSISWYVAYLSRFLFRLCEVSSRCMVLALIWSTWSDHTDPDNINYSGAIIVGGIIGLELIFYTLLTQFRIPPWEIAAFLIVNIDLTLTFEGREGALTKPLRKNPFYKCLCKPVAEMFTRVSDQTERYYEEHRHFRTSTHKHKAFNAQNAQWKNENNRKKHKNVDPQRQKLLIAPAHYVYRFLESVFEIFCVLTYYVNNPMAYDQLYYKFDTDENGDTIFDDENGEPVLKLDEYGQPEIDELKWQKNLYFYSAAIIMTILTPILYCTVRTFADESKTLERNLIAMVHHETETNEIIRLIGAGASLKQTDYEGNNIVHACIVKKNKELLKRIIKKYKRNPKSVGLNAANKKGYTPLLLAARKGALDCFKLLVHEFYTDDYDEKNDKGESLDFNQVHIHSGQSMIHIATEHNQYEFVEYLVNLGDNKFEIHATYTYTTVNGAEIKGYNACHVAARYNATDCMMLLLRGGVDFRAKLSNKDTCAIVAASRGHAVILQMLYDFGDSFNVRGNFGHTPLYRAAINNHPSCVLHLGEDWNANPNIPDENNMHIVTQCFQNCTFGVLSSLATLGCRFDLHLREKLIEIEIRKKGDIDDKLTALMWACKYNEPKLVKQLLESGANQNHINKLDETAAHHAAAMGSLECLKLLYRYKANLKLTNGANQTPRDKAIQQNRKNVIEWFNSLEKKKGVFSM